MAGLSEDPSAKDFHTDKDFKIELHLGTWDISLLVGYFVVIVMVSIWAARNASKHQRTATDYFLAEKGVKWWAIGLSLFASNIGSEQFVGLAGMAVTSGFAVGGFEWMSAWIVLLLAWVFLPVYLSAGIFTLPQYLGNRFDSKLLQMTMAVMSLILYVLTRISVTLFAGCLILEHVFHWNIWISAVSLIVVTGAYTSLGGLAAVIFTEVFQTVILLAGGLSLTWIALAKAGGYEGLVAYLPPSHFHLVLPVSDPDFPWTGVLFGIPITTIYYWCCDQVLVQRALGAASTNDAKLGTVLAGFLKITPVFMFVLPGMIARVLYPDEVLADPDSAYPLIISREMPEGIVGLVLVAVLAALMSSLASAFNSASTIFTFDLYKEYWSSRGQEPSQERLVFVGQAATFFMVVPSLLWLPLVRMSSSELYTYLQSVSAYLQPPIAAIYLWAIFWQRANAYGAFAGLIGGWALGIFRLVIEIVYESKGLAVSTIPVIGMHYLHFAAFSFSVSSFILLVVSLSAPPVAPGSHNTWWDRKGSFELNAELGSLLDDKKMCIKSSERQGLLSDDASRSFAGRLLAVSSSFNATETVVQEDSKRIPGSRTLDMGALALVATIAWLWNKCW